MQIVSVSRYWHTLRFLRPVQIYGRLWHRLYKPSISLANLPTIRDQVGGWSSPALRQASLVDQGSWIFLNEPGDLAEIGWDGPQCEKLWRYNQHYFDDLNARDAHTRNSWQRELIADWVEKNPPGKGVGWEPYPTSLRIVNWIKWVLAGNVLEEAWVHDLSLQVRWLSKRLEFHLLGNHLLANAKALIFAGLFFCGPEAERWLQKGRKILAREVPEQVLADGGHFERSPLYHLIVLEDLLDLVNLYRAYGQTEPVELREAIQRMLYWSAVMRHPDDEIPFFNDSAFGIAPSPNEIQEYAARLGFSGLPSIDRKYQHLDSSGYIRLQAGAALVLADMAPVGPDYLPGHAHADTLSFELSIGYRRVIVNGGTSVYGSGAERHRQRSTAAHSTVVVDGENSSEVWGGFRVARRARVLDARCGEDNLGIWAEGAHDGYARLHGAPVHHRRWVIDPGTLRIIDRVEGAGTHEAEIFFPFAPGWRPTFDGAKRVLIIDHENDRLQMVVEAGADANVFLEPTTWHPEFGVSVPVWRIRIALTGCLPLMHETVFQWCEK
ncbi:MAG: alginate lyase family protein [Desulfoprunum sp.]|uniref:heparinase II/III family protein n=1 Tax=Desulfoprunum sp. TaxID=2020866 RepID=UPI003C7184C7